MDETLLEAAADLGCPRWKAFWLVTVPLALPGVIAGAILCFIPIVGEFVIPDLLGGSGTMMIGQTLWLEFFGNRDWPAASAVAVVLLALLIVPLIVIYQHLQARRAGSGRLTMRRGLSLVNVTVARARAGVPLSADPDPGDLFVQRVAAGHGLGRLVDALVRLAPRQPGDARRRLDFAAHRLPHRLRGDRARHARRARAGARRPFPRARCCSAGSSMRRW